MGTAIQVGTGQSLVKVNTRPWIVFGLFWVIAVFGILGGWALLAPISSAVIAQGAVAIDGKRKLVQHLEGVIVKELLVADGDVVTAGQTLAKLNATRAIANLGIIQSALDSDMASEARLIAERDELASIAYPTVLTERSDQVPIAQLVESQNRIFRARRAAIAGEQEILQQRIAQVGEEISGLNEQRKAKARQITLIAEELASLQGLLDKGQTTRPRVLALRRVSAALGGEEGELIALIARAKKSIGETRLAILQRQKDFQKAVSEELQNVQSRLRDLRERAIASKDQLERIDIVAPVGGTVVNMAVHTVGAVIKPGETILDIVPGPSNLVIEAIIRPQDIDNVTHGQRALIRMLAFKQRTTPLIHGQVIYVSADSLKNSDTHQMFYVAHVEVPDNELKRLDPLRLKPGMPAEIMIQTGERTAFRYVLQPVIDSMNRSLREE
jgi:HlyD family secretion protein/epimerase transport system membrane fusion protein